jgi:alkylation response protein AidB-like acyl-CoA dehydrogenase
MPTAADYRKFTDSPVERVHKMKDVIVRGGDEAQQLRHLPQWLTDALVEQNIFRFTLPENCGGEDASVRTTIDVLEAVAAIDGSVGWNVMIGSEINAMAAGGMPKELIQEVFLDNPRVIMCGGGGPGTQPSRALKDGSGWRVFAQSTFMSGCHNSTWAFQSAPLFDGEKPILDERGMPQIRTFFLHRDQWEIVDTWNVASLRGSGSHDVRSNGAFVSERYAGVQLQLPATNSDNPVFRMPVNVRLSFNKAGVALGIARGAIDAVIDLAQNKTPWLSATTLKDRPMAQYRVGEAEATYRAAKAFLNEAMDGVADTLKNGEPQPSWDSMKIARLACLHAAQSCMHVVDLMHNTAGTSSIRMDSPLERKLRDAHGAASHRWVGPQLYEELGRVFLGHEPGMGLQ